MWQNRFLEKAKYLEVKSQVWKTRIPWSLRIIFHIFFKLPWIYILTIKRRLNPLNLGFWSINFNFSFNIYLTVKSLNSCNHFLIKCLVQILEITLTVLLIHWIPLLLFYASWNHHNTRGFPFSGGIETNQWNEIG